MGSVSHGTTISVMDSLVDEEVFEWQDSLKEPQSQNEVFIQSSNRVQCVISNLRYCLNFRSWQSWGFQPFCQIGFLMSPLILKNCQVPVWESTVERSFSRHWGFCRSDSGLMYNSWIQPHFTSFITSKSSCWTSLTNSAGMPQELNYFSLWSIIRANKGEINITC